MRARPNLSGEQIVTDYLTRVAQAARLLPKGARMAFVGRTRALVEREVGPPGTRTDPERVSAALARLGTPEELVTVERTRIDQGWLKSRAATKEEGEAAAAALTGPRMNRSFTARAAAQLRHPAPDRQADPARGGPDRHRPRRHRHQGPGTTAQHEPAALHAARRKPAGCWCADCRAAGRGHRRRRYAQRCPPGHWSPQAAQRGFSGARATGRAPQGAAPHGASQRDTKRQGADAGDTGHTGAIERLIGQVPGIRGVEGAETFTANAGRLARENILESVAILLLGLGGLILPFPFWPIGAIVSLFSRLWDIKDKSLAFIGPLLVTLALSVIAAPFVGGSGNFVVVYFHALHVSFGLLVRVGSVITAAYLAWRVSKGPRVKVPPWQRISR